MSCQPNPAVPAMADARAHVYVVDDDPSICKALARLLVSADNEVSTFTSAEAFLAQPMPTDHGCIILDVAMPGSNGLALQQQLTERGNTLPIIFLTGQADVAMCAQAMKHGAVDFLTKPVDGSALFDAVANALVRDAASRVVRDRKHEVESRLDTLTRREREVLQHVIAGRLNKQIAAELGAAEKTIKVHRARGMEKMQVRSVAELVRMIERSHTLEANS